MRWRLVGTLVLASCGGPSTPTTFPERPAAETLATLAGHRCKTTTHCTCRIVGELLDQAEKSSPAEGTKRFELRVLSSMGTAWVTIDGTQQLYKDAERAEDCFYVDLPPGEHEVKLYARSREGEAAVGTGLRIHEYRPEGDQWYDSFLFQCGVPGPCAKEALVAWKNSVEADRSLLRDHCGSTKVNRLAWETGRMPDALHPEEIAVTFQLKVYDFTPRHPPRSPECPTK